MAVPFDAIAQNPIGNGLDEPRDALKPICNKMGICGFPNLRENAALLEASSGMVPISFCLFSPLIH